MKFTIQGGAEIDIATKDEIDEMLSGQNKALLSAFTDGLKYARSLDAVTSAATKNVSAVLPNASPAQGFVRSIRRVSINTNDGGAGAYTGALYLNDPNAIGNFAYSFSMNLPGFLAISDDALILRPDDQLYLVVSSGGAVAGSTYAVQCAYKEVTVEKLFLLDF